MIAFGVFLGGAAGAVCRYAVDGAVQTRRRGPFPWGTFVVNISGALLLGVLVGATALTGARAVVGSGFLGGYTTFSTLAYETMILARDGAHGYAALNLVASIGAGLAAAAAGLWLGGLL